MNSEEIYDAVTQRYSSLGTTPLGDGYGRSVAQAFGYTKEDLDSIPTESNLGLSCGNPLAIASLREGETVIDFGSGAGFDVFLAAKAIGPTGHAIGVDMNKDMLALAEKNKTKSGATNVDFLKARITNIPLDGGMANVVMSNCVVNLVPENEKQLVFNEMFRLLKPGGRVALSDILAKKTLPETLQKSVAAYVGCIAGASLVMQYEEYLRKAGFTDVLIKGAHNDLNVYIDALPDGSKDVATEPQTSGCCKPETASPDCCATFGTTEDTDLAKLAADLQGVDLNEWVGSFKIFAVKR